MDNLPKRKRIRLKGYDYSQAGAYFVTICAYNREHLFGSIPRGLCSCEMSDIGNIIQSEIEKIEIRYNTVRVDKYVIMPNHVHMIIFLGVDGRGMGCEQGQEQSPCPTATCHTCPTIGDVVCALKSLTTKYANKNDMVMGRKIWQFRFHDHIIRNQQEYQRIWEYIDANPLKWGDDCFHSE